MQPEDILKSIAKVGGTVRNFGIVLLVLGVVAVLAPQQTGMAVSIAVGVLLILYGLVRTAFAWLAPGWGPLFLRSIGGVLAIVAGGYMVAQPGAGAAALAIVLVAYLFADGIISLLFALRITPAAGGAWLMLSAIVSLIAGVLLWTQWPASGDLAVGVLIGIKMIVDGIQLIGLGQSARALAD